MSIDRCRPRATRTGVAALAALTTVVLVACTDSTAGDETGADVEDVVSEPESGADPLIGEEVELSAEVDEVLAPGVLTIAGTEDTDVEPLLVVRTSLDIPLAPDQAIRVYGTVGEAFVITEAEEDLGTDLDDTALAEWEGEPYVLAERIDVIESDREQAGP